MGAEDMLAGAPDRNPMPADDPFPAVDLFPRWNRMWAHLAQAYFDLRAVVRRAVGR